MHAQAKYLYMAATFRNWPSAADSALTTSSLRAVLFANSELSVWVMCIVVTDLEHRQNICLDCIYLGEVFTI